MYHKNAALGDIHKAVNWVVADAAALAALVVTVDDLYKFAFQVDTGEVWLLTADTPVWSSIGSGAGNNSELIAFRGYRDTDQAIAASGRADAQINAKTLDTHTFFDEVNFRFQPTDGIARLYNVKYSFHGLGTSLTAFIGIIRKNGIDYSFGTQAAAASGVLRTVGTDIVELDGTSDYLEFQVSITGSSALKIGGSNAAQSTCSVYSIGIL